MLTVLVHVSVRAAGGGGAPGGSVSAGGEPPGRARVHLSGDSQGAESQRGFGGRSPRQPQREGAPFPGGAQTSQPLLHHPQHGAAEANRGRGIPLFPAARRPAEAAPAADAAEAGTPCKGQRSGFPVQYRAELSTDAVRSLPFLSCGQTQAQECSGVFEGGACPGMCAHRESDGPRGAHGHARPRTFPPPSETPRSLQARCGTETAPAEPGGGWGE